MFLKLDQRVQAQYGRLYVSTQDLATAGFCLQMLIKKGWHSLSHQRRGTIYQQQTAYTTAFVVAYARPFTQSIGWPPFPPELIGAFSAEQGECHERILQLRHSVYAHSDSRQYSIRPWRSGDFETTIVGSPPLFITKQDATLLQSMIQDVSSRIQQKMKALLPATDSAPGSPVSLPFDELEVGEFFFVPFKQ